MIRRARLRARKPWRTKPKPADAPRVVGRPALSTSDYRVVHARVLKRDHYRCRRCGSTQYPQVHHVKKRSAGGSDHEDNLVTLCGVRGGCHDATDRPYIEGRLIVTALGGGDFTFRVVTRASKWSPDPAA